MKEKMSCSNLKTSIICIGIKFFKPLFLAGIIITLFSANGFAQYVATWVLTSDKTVVVSGVQSANVGSGNMVPGSVFENPGSHNTDGYRCQIPTSPWPIVPTDGYNIDFPVSPVGANDLTISALTFTAKTSGGSGNSMVSLAYQADGAGAWVSFGTAQTAASGGTTNINFGSLSTVFTNGHTYVVRVYVYAAGTTSSSRKVYIKNVVISGSTAPGGPPPTVLTTAAASTGRTTATVSGNITSGGTAGVSVSGFCWGTSINPTDALATKTTNGPTAGTYTSPINGLSAGTLYHVRAYATNAVGTSYGADLSFTTDPPVIPTITTNATTGITIFTATSGGNITDDGGSAVSVRGVCVATTSNPTTANGTTVNGSGSGSFVSGLTGLLPSTTYYVRSYATNTVGTAYGNQQTFTTPPPTPTLFTNPSILDFGSVLQNSNSVPQSFNLTGFYLNPASGNITVTAPAGFRISLSSGGAYYPTIQVPYTGGALGSTAIYVRFSPTQVRTFDDSVRSVTAGASMVFVRVKGISLPTGLQSSQGLSNKGKEFWVGYGATEKMYSDNSQDMRFTFNNSNSTPATVTLSMPNIPTFIPVVYVVAANSSITTNANDFPESGLEDSRLLNEGVYTSGIRIASDVPIVVYCHAITSQVYAASVLFPTPTLGREYTSLNFRQRSNYSGAKSYLFVVATEDNTQIEVTLPAGVETDTHAAGSTFTQNLNKGEILNLFGKTIGRPDLYTGNDLSGTVVRSISTTSSCKPFAMYCGSSKITIDCDNGSNGSADNLFQQMFPKQAWGNKVIAIPTLPLPYNHYRILVGDPTTVVKRNGVALSGIINNKYYEYYNGGASVDVLEGDKPIMVAQYMTTHNECNNAGAVGDPEMIYLSSLQQTIDSISFVSSPLGNSSGRTHYLNVAIPTAGVSTFKLDGVSQASSFIPVAFDPATSYAQILVNEGFHDLTSTSGFNATAYGVANDESYGYNAGTNVKNLLTGFSLQNQYGTGTASNACRNNEFFVRVTLSFKPTSLSWNFFGNPNLTPNAIFTQTNPVVEDSFVVNNQMLYVFKNPTPYLYNLVGQIPVEVTAVSPIPDGCNGQQKLSFSVNVVQGPTASFGYTNTGGCLNNPIQFTDNTISNGLNLDLWQWSFGDAPSGANNSSILQSPSHAFSSGGSFTITQHVVTLEGCYDDSVITLNLSSQPVASFTAPAQSCQSQSVTFVNTSTIASGTITQWAWNFGDATPVVNASSGIAQTHTYLNAGTYTVTLNIVSSTGCSSILYSQQIVINPLPTVSFAPITAVVCTNTAPFALTGGVPATVAGVGTGTYSGTGVSGGIFNPSISGAGTFVITYTYTTAAGCVRSATQSILVTQTIVLSLQQVGPFCINDGSVTLTPSTSGGVFSGAGVVGNTFNPSVAGVGVFTIGYTIPSNVCSVPATIQVQVNPRPTVNFAPLAGVCTSTAPFALSGGSPATAAGVGTGTYSGIGVSNGIFSPSVSGAGSFPITYTYVTAFGCVNSVTSTIVVTQTYNLTIQPISALCSNGPAVSLVPSVAGGVFSGPGVSGNTFNPTTSGVGTFNISYAMVGNSCTIPASRTIVVNPVPTVNAGADITMLLGSAGTLWGTASAGTYLWSPTTELSLPTELITRANPMTTTTYKLTATNGFGCKVSDDVVVNVVIPCVDPSNVFTPNNDGFYDKWNVFNGSCVKNIEVDVYNRWGGLVFHSDHYMNDWDGNSKNKPLPDGTYYYMIKATLVGDFKSTLKGNVTIMR